MYGGSDPPQNKRSIYDQAYQGNNVGFTPIGMFNKRIQKKKDFADKPTMHDPHAYASKQLAPILENRKA